MTATPPRNHVFIKADKIDSTASGLIVITSNQEQTGIIAALGEQDHDNGLAVGMKVVYDTPKTTKIQLKSTEYLHIAVADILAVYAI